MMVAGGSLVPQTGNSAEPSQPDVVQTILQSARQIPDEASREAFVRQSLQSHFDFAAFYEAASQDFWDTWTADQKREFAARFETLFLRSLAEKFQRAFSPAVGLTAGNTEISGDRAVQSFRATKGDHRVSFTVHLIKRDQSWKIYDVEFEEILLSRNYRAQFNRVLRNEGFTGLIARFDSKLTETGGKP